LVTGSRDNALRSPSPYNVVSKRCACVNRRKNIHNVTTARAVAGCCVFDPANQASAPTPIEIATRKISARLYSFRQRRTVRASRRNAGEAATVCLTRRRWAFSNVGE